MLNKIASTIHTCEAPKVIKLNNIKYHQYSFCLPTLESGKHVSICAREATFNPFWAFHNSKHKIHGTLEKKYLHLNQIVIIHPTC